MKKILIICYDFPPLPSVASQRPYSWSKFFSRNGIYPIIITRKWADSITDVSSYFLKDKGKDEEDITENYQIIKIPYKTRLKSKLYKSSNFVVKIIRKAITAIEHLLKWHGSAFDETYFLYKKARLFLLENKVDYLLVTGQPFTLFKYAYELNKEFKIPYILDYRDGWTTDHAIKGIMLKLFSFQEKKLESKYLSNASFFIASSNRIIEENKRVFPNINGYLHENGVDIGLIRELKESVNQDKSFFYISFTGSLYNKHNVEIFLKGVELLIQKNKVPNLKIRFIGIDLKPSKKVELVKEFQAKYPDFIEVIGAVSHNEALKYQLTSSLLLKFDYTGQHQGLLGAKLYEYAATNIPILTVLSIDNKATTFYPGRKIQYMVNTVEEISLIVEELYLNYTAGEVIKTDLTEEEILSFSREKKVKELADIIDEIK